MTAKLNLIETIANDGKFSTFSRMMGTSGANEVFSAAGDFTVMAPTNDAFAKIPDAEMNALLNEENQIKLKALLSYHILPGKLWAANVASKQAATTVTGQDVAISDTNGIKINGSRIQARNIEASNGVIHAIETVLAPPAPTEPAKPVTEFAAPAIDPAVVSPWKTGAVGKTLL